MPLAWFPRLLHATPEQRAACAICRYGRHGEAIVEDISIEGLLAGSSDMTHRSHLSA
ncbi:DUF2442 domain-containing protein [Paraburkholderia sartisoli]|uniref:DUF2442 domain-containing protein n=1 Tax=Paraburkholderia sartisoli TaxID=83784 RepID=UPI001FE17EE4|nr:DUF2442 domain-containing protein [Paraburkholderia sartisoli]